MKIITIKNKIALDELVKMSEKMYGDLVKAVVDIEKEIMAVDADLHSDELDFLIEEGSYPTDLWGINIYPKMVTQERIEFDSMINLRPGQNNHSRGVESDEIRQKIIEIVNKLIENGN